jgi:hypothetical protein
MTYKQFAELNKVTLDVRHLGVHPETINKKEFLQDSWHCALGFNGHEMLLTFNTGLGLRKLNKAKFYKRTGRMKPTNRDLYNLQGASNKVMLELYDPAEPKIEDILYCVVSDAQCYDNSRDFEDFCSDLGYDTDSIKAKKCYDACAEQTKKLRYLFENQFPVLMECTEDEEQEVITA